MTKRIRPVFFTLILLLFVLLACNRKKRGGTAGRSPREIQKMMPDLIRDQLNDALAHDGRLVDSVQLWQASITKKLYEKIEFQPAWSNQGKWEKLGDSLLHFIEHAKLFGLFPQDYHGKELLDIRSRFSNDSTGKDDRKDAGLWARADLLLTDAFVQVIRDLKLGRIPADSITLRKDSILTDEFYLQKFDQLRNDQPWGQWVRSLEPRHPGYWELKNNIPRYLDSADNRNYTKVPLPGTDRKIFRAALQKRLFEGGFLVTDSVIVDSVELAAAIRKFQQKKGIVVDGRAGGVTLRMLNTTEQDKFVRIAITMDKYKLLPEEMPARYIWVNLPGYNLVVRERDSVVLSSKIVCGKPITNTPQLTSAISELITYPQWNIPTSIIMGEILPAVKRNPGYLAKKGFSIYDRKGEQVDPYSVNWAKYSKGFPYRVIQGSGDANALGVLKFNFSNKYSVYLHDTNQRYLFGLPTRALSHGCVRVQEWRPLATYILRNDNNSANAEGGKSRVDSMTTWLARKQKRSSPIRNRVPLFIRYFTCEGKNGNIVFYDDIYGEDKGLQERYFAGK